MKLKNPFRTLSRGEWALWLISMAAVTLCTCLTPAPDIASLCASLIGVTALIFVAKGHPMGQILTIVFAVFYGAISFSVRYYGEMLTYLCMTAPMAAVALVTWLKHPYQDSEEVAVGTLRRKTVIFLWLGTAAVTFLFYFVLKAFGTAQLAVSTLSIATSFLASALTALRSPYYALAYASNDIVLIVLWCLAASQDAAGLPMAGCFTMFLVNDLYGFCNWKRMAKRQSKPCE